MGRLLYVNQRLLEPILRHERRGFWMKQVALSLRSWALAWPIARRELRALLTSPGIYVVASLAAVAESQALAVPLGLLADLRLYVATDPLLPAFLTSIVIVGLFAAIAAAATLVQEKERKTLRTLLYTPVEFSTIVLGKYGAIVLASLLALSMAMLFLLFSAWLTSLRPSWQLLLALLLGGALVSAMVAFGLAVSAVARSTRAALLLLIGTLILLFGLQLAGRVVEQMLAMGGGGALAYLLPLVNGVAAVAAVISPLAYVLRGIEAISLGSTADYLLSLGATAVYSLVFLALAIWQLRRQEEGAE